MNPWPYCGFILVKRVHASSFYDVKRVHAKTIKDLITININVLGMIFLIIEYLVVSDKSLDRMKNEAKQHYHLNA
jgi:hypothetical protein